MTSQLLCRHILRCLTRPTVAHGFWPGHWTFEHVPKARATFHTRNLRVDGTAGTRQTPIPSPQITALHSALIRYWERERAKANIQTTNLKLCQKCVPAGQRDQRRPGVRVQGPAGGLPIMLAPATPKGKQKESMVGLLRSQRAGGCNFPGAGRQLCLRAVVAAKAKGLHSHSSSSSLSSISYCSFSSGLRGPGSPMSWLSM